MNDLTSRATTIHMSYEFEYHHMNVDSSDGEVATTHDSPSSRCLTTPSFKETLCALGLLPFLAWFILAGSVVALIVFLNGIVFHIFLPRSFLMKSFDICCNTVLVVLINILAWNLIVTLLTCLGATCFLLNSIVDVQGFGKAVVHVVGVQIPLFVALVVAEVRKPYLAFF